MGMNDIVKFGGDHYTVGWDDSFEAGIGAIVLLSDLPAIWLDSYPKNPGFKARLYVTEQDLDILIKALEDYKKKMFGG